jgi:hypothetical protein
MKVLLIIEVAAVFCYESFRAIKGRAFDRKDRREGRGGRREKGRHFSGETEWFPDGFLALPAVGLN